MRSRVRCQCHVTDNGRRTTLNASSWTAKIKYRRHIFFFFFRGLPSSMLERCSYNIFSKLISLLGRLTIITTRCMQYVWLMAYALHMIICTWNTKRHTNTDKYYIRKFMKFIFQQTMLPSAEERNAQRLWGRLAIRNDYCTNTAWCLNTHTYTQRQQTLMGIHTMRRS